MLNSADYTRRAVVQPRPLAGARRRPWFYRPARRCYNRSVKRKNTWYWLAWAAIIAATLVGLARAYVGSIALDDAYITYRYARNLAETGALVYNPGQPENAFATTAPAYAVALAGLNRLGADIPWIAALGGVLGIVLAAWALGDGLRRASRASGFPWPEATGLAAGGLLAFAPLLWLVLGMEGLAALGLTLLGFWCANRRQDTAAAALLALAVLLRFDAAAAVAAWGALLAVRLRWRAWRPLALCAGLIVGIYGLMHLLLDVPLPSTLASKQAQVALGITGFFPNASYLDGASWIIAGYWRHAPWAAALLAVLALVGLARMAVTWRGSRSAVRADPAQSSLGIHHFIVLLLLWTGLHLALYVGLGVTPYLWYYLPFVVMLSALAAVGLTTAACALPGAPAWLRPLALGLLAAMCATGIVRTHQAMQQQVQVYADLPVADPRSAVLPGVQIPSYRQAGEWLAANTPANATVGVADVGLIGYYSQRPMIDFWGLLDRDVAGALARRDLVWALYHYQPDYLALYGEAPLFGYDIFKDRWFQSAYEPVHRVPAGKVTIYRRKQPAVAPATAATPPPEATPQVFRFGDELELVAYSTPPAPWSPDTPLHVIYYWRVLRQPDRDYTVFTHLRDSRGAIVATRDAPPLLGSRPTSQWRPGELIADFHPLGFDPLPLAPTDVSFEVGLYDQSGQRLPVTDAAGAPQPWDEADFGSAPLLPAGEPALLAARAPNSARLAVASYRLGADTLARGQTTTMSIEVAECDCPVQMTAELWDVDGERLIWQQARTVEKPGWVEFDVEAPAGEMAVWPQLRLRAHTGDVPLYFTDRAGNVVNDYLPLTMVLLSDP